MTEQQIIQAIQAEVLRQRQKWGEQRHHPHTWLAILTEEVGEAAEASLRERDDDLVISAGTLYRSLEQMVNRGLLAEEESSAPNTDERRRFYSATDLGRQQLQIEIMNLKLLIQIAEGKTS